MKSLYSLLILFTLAAFCVPASADRIVLKDGSSLDGTVLQQGDSYWVKTPDGASRLIPADQVQSVIKGGTGSSGGPSPAGATTTPANGSTALRTAVAKAAACDRASAAVIILQEFVDKHPGSPDLPFAGQELDRWKKMAADGAERINSKWVSGDERKKILDQANALIREGAELLEKQQLLQAVDKFQKSVKIYPNSFLANFFLGTVAMFEKKYDESIGYYNTAVRLDPDSVEAANNLAIANVMTRHYEAAVLGFAHAAELRDNQQIAQNLFTALYESPDGVRRLSSLKKAKDAANLFAMTYHITAPAQYAVLNLSSETIGKHHSNDADPDFMWSGSGFFISGDGLILTNRHVAKAAPHLSVYIGDKEHSAEIVAVDDEQDLALIRIKVDDKTPFLRLIQPDLPAEGAQCTVMGFPLPDRLGSDIKITRGIVSGMERDAQNGVNLLTDAKINPGNSGGPMVDDYGNVMAVASAKSRSSTTEDSYGMGIGAGLIRKFLAKNKITLTPGPSDKKLSSEEIAAKVTPATVCIIATR